MHTQLLDEQQVDLSFADDRQHATYRIEIRQCPTCQQLWWMHLHSEIHETHERDSMPPVVIGSVAVTHSAAVRCPDRASADELTLWLPRHLDALVRCQRAHAGGLIAAVRACVELAALNPHTMILADNAALPRESDNTRVRHDTTILACAGVGQIGPPGSHVLTR